MDGKTKRRPNDHTNGEREKMHQQTDTTMMQIKESWEQNWGETKKAVAQEKVQQETDNADKKNNKNTIQEDKVQSTTRKGKNRTIHLRNKKQIY